MVCKLGSSRLQQSGQPPPPPPPHTHTQTHPQTQTYVNEPLQSGSSVYFYIATVVNYIYYPVWQPTCTPPLAVICKVISEQDVMLCLDLLSP